MDIYKIFNHLVKNPKNYDKNVNILFSNYERNMKLKNNNDNLQVYVHSKNVYQ